METRNQARPSYQRENFLKREHEITRMKLKEITDEK
jgi:hypothetical protein